MQNLRRDALQRGDEHRRPDAREARGHAAIDERLAEHRHGFSHRGFEIGECPVHVDAWPGHQGKKIRIVAREQIEPDARRGKRLISFWLSGRSLSDASFHASPAFLRDSDFRGGKSCAFFAK